LGDALGVAPSQNEPQQPILMLGCGNSRLGEEMIQEGGWYGPILQVDVSSRVVESMSQRCAPLIEQGHMNFIQDDATELSAFRNGMIHACLDKGLIDAVYCADEYDQCSTILKSVHRVLKPGGVFCFLSFTRPEFFLPNVLLSEHYQRKTVPWDKIEIQVLPKIMLYRFQKSLKEEEDSKSGPSSIRRKEKSSTKRRKRN
jgi:ubiquinone/menaquinone biosynthesis C-methylase UbiE